MSPVGTVCRSRYVPCDPGVFPLKAPIRARKFGFSLLSRPFVAVRPNFDGKLREGDAKEIAMSDLPIKKLGPYTIEGIVGRGGMGSVYAGTHEETGENAAIKVLAPAMASDETFRERFIAEIESLKTLNHPNIVTLHGYGEYEGHLYYAMELVDGTNLDEELRRGRRFHWREVTQYGLDISRALKHAHDHGVIHRDLKPANLLLDRKDDQLKLTDFGIAKLFGGHQPNPWWIRDGHSGLHGSGTGCRRSHDAEMRFV